MSKIKVGIVGCGNISDIYLTNCRAYDALEIVRLADIDLERASAKATQYGVPDAGTLAELLSDPTVDIVLNLTIPAVHAEVSLAALEAGKHVYSEKPLATTMEDGRRILELADSKGLRVGVAPDTVLGGGIQTCRKLIDDGAVGQPVAATAFMMTGGPERWHPNPGFLYEIGAGPMFDMGPYYLSAFITLLGPIRRVTGSAVISYPERVIASQPLYGQKIQVQTPTHISGVLDFVGGATASLITSFDVKGGTSLSSIEIYGSEGTLLVPDPNTFGGLVKLRKPGPDQAWQELTLTHAYTDNSRGIGLLDMALSIREGTPHRATGEVALQVLEAMHGFHIASREERHYRMQSLCERPLPMPSLPQS
ncbi:Gfo/Idh/MocA family protein [Cohnella boryungensis]|uniref:Gfo/Idh/MocA family protein n=1 Tax=Cohnella boryungensis TaxID=768479 RepID=A0ABV8S561_9BACL